MYLRNIRASVVFVSSLTLTLMASAPMAQAQETAAERSAARDLGYEGVQSYQEGDYATAVARLEKAYDILRAPSLGLWSARALEKSGRLVEAAERYLETSRQPVDRGGDIEVQEQAIADAEAEYEALQPRIPKLTIEVVGEGEYSVRLGEETLSNKMVGVPVPVDPGELVVVFTSGDRSAQKEVTLAEGAKETLTFKAVSSAHAPKERGGAAENASGDPLADSEAPSGKTQKILGWAAVGLGGAALIGGGVTVGIMASKRSSLNCDGKSCPPDTDQGDVDSFNSMRPIPTILFGVGGALAVTGFALVLTAPKDSTSAHISPYVGLSTAGFAGRF